MYRLISFAAASSLYLQSTHIKVSPVYITTKKAFGICVLIIRSHNKLSGFTANTMFCADGNIPLSDSKLIHVRKTAKNIENEVIYQC